MSQRTSKTKFIPVLVVSAAFLTACQASGNDDHSDDTHLTLAYNWYPTCFDYAQSNPAALYGRQVVDTLLSENPETAEIEPYLAESWEVDDRGQTYQFTLQDGVTFSNGEVLDAQVVADNFTTLWALAEQGVASTAGNYLHGFESAEALDEHTVRVVFSEPNAGFLQATTEGQLGIIAPESLALSPEERCADGVIGSGPFILDESVQDERVEYVRRDGYNWAPAAFGREGDAGIEHLTIQIIPEESVAVSGLLAGDYDLVYSVTETGLSQADGQDAVEAVLAPNRGVVNNLLLNTSDSILSDPTVRQALQHGIDREELVNTFFGAGVEAATDVVSTGHPFYTDHGDLLRFDPDRSRSILEDAGWTEGEGGIRVKNGQSLQLTLTVSASYTDNYIEYLQSRLQDIGISLRLQQVSDAELTDLRSSGDWQVVIYQGAARGDADGIAAFYSTELSDWGSALAPRPKIDALLEEQGSTIDPDQRKAVVDEAVSEILEQAYAVPLFDSAQVILVSDEVQNLQFPINSWEPILYAVEKNGA